MTNSYINNSIPSEQQSRIPNSVATTTVRQNNAVAPRGFSPAEDAKPVPQTLLRSTIIPEEARRGIVNDNFVQRRVSNAKGIIKTYGYFVDAVIDGKGTDYTVGRINDGAKFLGSLGIAAAIASGAKTPKTKLMEFVGFATWFGAMAFWPELLGIAVKATKGVDMNQEYVDSYGRRKRFFEDPQYLTWDLYSKKQLNKIGDKLGVPRNIENREEAIKEKAKQVSIQGNTLVMLTAGFATPIVSSLAANYIDKGGRSHLSSFIANRAYKNAQKQIKKAESSDIETIDRAFKAVDSYMQANIGNIEGSKIANDWVITTQKLLKPLQINNETFNKVISEENPHERAKIIAKHFVEKFGGEKNKDARDAALKAIMEINKRPVETAQRVKKEMLGAEGLVGKLREKLQEAKLSSDELNKFSEKLDKYEKQIPDRILNTKAGFYKFVNIIDFMNTHPDFKKGSNESKMLEQIVFSVTSDDGYNGIEKLKHLDGKPVNNENMSDAKKLLETINPEKLHNGTKAVLKKAAEDVEKSNIELNEKLLLTHPRVAESQSRGIPARAAEWSGKPFVNMFTDAAKEAHTYKNWLRKAGIMGAAVLGVSAIAIAMFGNKNYYNQDIYEYKQANNRR